VDRYGTPEVAAAVAEALSSITSQIRSGTPVTKAVIRLPDERDDVSHLLEIIGGIDPEGEIIFYVAFRNNDEKSVDRDLPIYFLHVGDEIDVFGVAASWLLIRRFPDWTIFKVDLVDASLSEPFWNVVETMSK